MCADDCPVCDKPRPVAQASAPQEAPQDGQRFKRLGTLSVSGAVLAGSLGLTAGVAAAEPAPSPGPAGPTTTNSGSPLGKLPQQGKQFGDVVSAALQVGDSAALRLLDMGLANKAKRVSGAKGAAQDTGLTAAEQWQKSAQGSLELLLKRLPNDSQLGKSVHSIVDQVRDLAKMKNCKVPDDIDVDDMIATIVGGMESALQDAFCEHKPPKKKASKPATPKQEQGNKKQPKLSLPDLEVPVPDAEQQNTEPPELAPPEPEPELPEAELPDPQPTKLDLPDLETPGREGKPPKADLPDPETPKPEPRKLEGQRPEGQQPEGRSPAQRESEGRSPAPLQQRESEGRSPAPLQQRESVGSPKIDIPGLPEIRIPGVKLPKIKMPDLELPKLPGLPEGELPKLPELPKPELPTVHLPDSKPPKAHLPEDHRPKQADAAPQ